MRRSKLPVSLSIGKTRLGTAAVP
eukprot:COSAG05_NODE_132_length_17128_cov_54.447355_1_plen_23_part_10